tara:strand:+ start:292 stop:615 length:324 start_codon:yes stop_codon:yes gene_type:complete
MREYKIIGFKFPVKLHADLKVRLKYDGIAMTRFVRSLAEAYLNNDRLIVEFIKQQKEKNKLDNKEKREKNVELINKGHNLSETFNLSGQEIGELYDILEEELEVTEI